MKSQRGPTSRWKQFVIAAAFVAGVMPSVAFATDCASGSGVQGMITGVLVETMESAPAHAAPGGTGPLAAGSYPPGQGVRLAQATEQGTLGVPGTQPCGTLAYLAGTITVHAQSTISYTTDENGDPVINPVSGLVDLTSGPINGVFKIQTATGNVSGSIDGTLNFKSLCPGAPACPLVAADGTWATKGQNKLTGAFTGVAVVPFQLPGVGWVYLDPTGGLLGPILFVVPGLGPVVALTPADFDKFGSPEAKFVITLFQ